LRASASKMKLIRKTHFNHSFHNKMGSLGLLTLPIFS
jgi:hypothetical protein